ncbi:MAG: phosphatase PAP2 family protein [Lachnospiraceae bacterium]|nr:phosphatase PAP2 family protein [Lachnospiraceae bacterium]
MEAQILLFIQENIRNEVLDPIMLAITSLGNAGIVWIIISLILLIIKKTRKIGICCAVALILQLTLINGILKNIVGRIRPYEVIDGLNCLVGVQKDPSFPSGHTTSSFAVAWIIFKKLPKKFGIPALILAALIALSRLYVGVHYPTDVLAGVFIGILLGILAIIITDRLFERLKKKTDDADKTA